MPGFSRGRGVAHVLRLSTRLGVIRRTTGRVGRRAVRALATDPPGVRRLLRVQPGPCKKYGQTLQLTSTFTIEEES
jgi:hypothetical protein